MKFWHKLSLVFLAIASLGPLAVYAATCSLKSWNQGDVVQSSDLNNNFSCINTATPAGTPIVDATVATGAGINYQKLNLPGLYPQAWATLGSVACSMNGACAIDSSQRVTSITRTGAGVYVVALAYTAPNVHYLALLTDATTVGNTKCEANTLTVTGFTVNCWQLQIPASTAQGTPLQTAAADVTFGFLVMDDNPN